MPNEFLIDEVKKRYGKNKAIAKEIRDLKNEESDFRYLAELILEEFNDIDLSVRLCKAAEEELKTDFDKHLDLAFTVSNKIKDYDWSSLLAKTSAGLAQTASDFVGLGQLVSASDGINNKKWAKDFYDLALVKASDGDDFAEVAVSAYNDRYLDDPQLSAFALEKAIDKAKDVYHITSLANLVACNELPGGVEMVRKIFSKGAEKFSAPDDLEFLTEQEHKLTSNNS